MTRLRALIRRLRCAFVGHNTTHITADYGTDEWLSQMLAEPGRGSIVECRSCRRMVIKQDYATRQD